MGWDTRHVVGIYDSFGGMRAEGIPPYAAISGGLAEALVPCAFGLVVALTALWCYKYLLTEVAAFDTNMENASLQLINDLGRLAVK